MKNVWLEPLLKQPLNGGERKRLQGAWYRHRKRVVSVLFLCLDLKAGG